MNQEDYQKKIDEHRQSIGLETDETESRRSRRSSYAKKPKKKSKNLLIPSLFFIFILIPVCIFIYVKVFYNPIPEVEVATQGVVQIETKPISNTEDKQDKDEEVNTEPVITVPETEVKEESKVEEPEQEVKEETKAEQPVVAEPKMHIVKANETLYRIAINYYKDPNAVAKIKSANGLTSDNISAGQKLILP
jgi:LysM repeat protein